MTGNDIAPEPFRPRPADLSLALGLLTRIPLPRTVPQPAPDRPAAHAAWAYPLVGLVVSVLMMGGLWLATSAGLPAAAAAGIALLISILCTGAMHEDGLADCADGFWGGWTMERRLEIMKDSQIGTYGVIALGVSLGLRWVAITALITQGGAVASLIGAAMISRAAMVWLMFSLPNARPSGLSRMTGRPPAGAVVLAGIIGAAALLFVTPAPAIGTLLCLGFGALGCRWLARIKIGGQTGDVLGGTQQVVETLVLLTCLASL